MFSNFKTTFKALGLVASALAFIFVVGCSSNSPTAPPADQGPEINTPKTLIIQKIVVTGFPSTKSNGDDWDWDPFFPGPRKPDIYATLGEKNASGEYRSVTKDNATSGKSYDLSSKAGSSKKSLPYELSYKNPYTFILMDDDGLLGSETMGSKTVYPSDLYGNDNAINFSTTISGSNGVKIKITGVWTY